ncbi:MULTISPECIES: AcvB/VirJ family lysyl-phosphatidylglycerol hydrolase [unclassified Sphingobacterium]|uniref:AcvB/VirJ family lysyl-phosphatidylglycerol hydrolase n=1 Tax=unclassified Sphingobacterium TaxID=2609468 RepID=UPI0025F95FB7|nr:MULTISPECIES: AcvB/VirJ family lysyl-phosphatidylglycerol hydrolase [unclassified Sphingobacterium]
MKKLATLFIIGSIAFHAFAQQRLIDMKYWNNKAVLPLVLYLSGDGGFNSFSNKLCELIAGAGYTVAAIDSKSYFWKKKSPNEIATDVSSTLKNLLGGRHNTRLFVVGYSFGADAVPFIINRLDLAVKKNLKSVVLLEPSGSTDLEIHIADILGRSNAKRSLDVVSEINRMDGVKTSVILGDDEADFAVKKVTLRNFSKVYLSGGHHFSGNAEQVAKNTVALF